MASHNDCIQCGSKLGILLCDTCKYILCKNCLGIDHTYEEDLFIEEDFHWYDCSLVHNMNEEEKNKTIKWCVYCKDGYEPEKGELTCNICKMILCKNCIVSRKQNEELLHYSNCSKIKKIKKEKK